MLYFLFGAIFGLLVAWFIVFTTWLIISNPRAHR